jgi:hypothetical protein
MLQRTSVMRGLHPRIQASGKCLRLDCRVKPGNDEEGTESR